MARQDLIRQARELQAKSLMGQEISVPEPKVSPLEVGTESAIVRVIDNILGLPQATGELLATGAGAIQAIGPKTLQESIREQREQFPAKALSSIPRIRVEDIVPGQKERQEFLSQQSPGAFQAGKVGGDIATMLMGRKPLARKLAQQKIPPTPLNLQPGVRRLVDRAVKNPKVQKLLRGAGRSAEAGLEGAILGTISEGDPTELAAFGAGAQVANSVILEAGKGIFSGGVLRSSLKLGLTAFAVGSLIQMAKTVTPGGKDFILESIESGYDKMGAALVLGAGSVVLGGGRVRGSKFAEDLPLFADAITSIPRAAALSTIKEYLQVDDVKKMDIERVTLKIAQDPDFFDKTTARKIDRAMKSPDVSLADTIDRLKRDSPSFRDKLNQIRE